MTAILEDVPLKTLKHCISVTSCSNNDKAISLVVYTVKTF